MSKTNTGDTKIKQAIEGDALSGFAGVLLKRMRDEGTSWDITLDAVEHIDGITDSSPGLAFAVLCIIDPKPDALITLSDIKGLSKELILQERGVKSIFELYTAMEKDGQIDRMFKR